VGLVLGVDDWFCVILFNDCVIRGLWVGLRRCLGCVGL